MRTSWSYWLPRSSRPKGRTPLDPGSASVSALPEVGRRVDPADEAGLVDVPVAGLADGRVRVPADSDAPAAEPVLPLADDAAPAPGAVAEEDLRIGVFRDRRAVEGIAGVSSFEHRLVGGLRGGHLARMPQTSLTLTAAQ